MLQSVTNELLGDYLLQIARDADLRLQVYEQLREYCHQCRNRLNSLKLGIYLAIRQAPSPTPESWFEIERDYQVLESRVELVQLLCRPLVLSRVTLGFDLLIEDRRDSWSQLMKRQGRDLEFLPPQDRAVVSFDVQILGRVFDSLVSWRASMPSAGRSARMSWWVENGLAHVIWDESEKSPASDETSPGSACAWTLPLLARVALAHGGDYQIETDQGWHLEVVWPAQTPSP